MNRIIFIAGIVVLLGLSSIVSLCNAQEIADYKYQATKDTVTLTKNAAGLVARNGEAAFGDFEKDGSKWRNKDAYVFVLDTDGNMLVHPDPALDGKNLIDMKDANGKPIIKGIIESTSSNANKNEGWFHYQWTEPGTIFTGWKSTFAKRIISPSGKTYVVCASIFNPKMEEVFLANAVNAAVSLIEMEGDKAFAALRDKSSQFVLLGTYIFVDTPEGVEVVNGGFPEVEGKNILDYKDPNGKFLTREVIDTAINKGSGWVDYMWPKPGETASSKKHTYVKKAVYADKTFAVGAGAYIDEGDAQADEPGDDDAGKVMMLELKSGNLAAGEIIRETKDSVFLKNSDGSMEVSFPRSVIIKIRKPTDKELEKIKKDLSPAVTTVAK